MLWYVSTHAIERYQERFAPGLMWQEVREELERIGLDAIPLGKAHRGGDLYGSPHTPSALYVVSCDAPGAMHTLITILPAGDSRLNKTTYSINDAHRPGGQTRVAIEQMRTRVEFDIDDALDPLSWLVIVCVIVEHMRSGVVSRERLAECSQNARRYYDGKLTQARISRLSQFTQAVSAVVQDTILHDVIASGLTCPDFIAAVHLVACSEGIRESRIPKHLAQSFSALCEACDATATELGTAVAATPSPKIQKRNHLQEMNSEQSS